MFEQDDVENWVSITDVSRGAMARRLLLNSRMGLTSDDRPLTAPLSDFTGPGEARVGYGEHNQRRWLGLWSDHLAERDVSVRAVTIAGRSKEVRSR
jgi:hypothetical protein